MREIERDWCIFVVTYFWLSCSHSKLACRFPRVVGNVPVNWFLSRRSSCRAPPTCLGKSGRDPLSWFENKWIDTIVEEKSKSSGIVPVNLLSSSQRPRKFDDSFGMGPSNLLLNIDSWSRFSSLSSCVGIVLVSLFWYIQRPVKSESWQSSVGIAPEKAFILISKAPNELDKNPNCEGIGPVRILSY